MIFHKIRGGNWHNPLNPSSVFGNKQTKGVKSAGEFNKIAKKVTGTADGFPDLDNHGIFNKEGTTYEMAWSEIGQDEVHDKLNDSLSK